MICPKGKISKARRDKRRAHTWRIATPGIIKCKKCGEFTISHRMCAYCNTYKSREVFPSKEGA